MKRFKHPILWIVLMAGCLLGLMAASAPFRGKSKPAEPSSLLPLFRRWSVPLTDGFNGEEPGEEEEESQEELEMGGDFRFTARMGWLPLPAEAAQRIWAFQGLPSVPPGPAAQEGKMEPTAAQVQQAAIRYAEVHPEKIARWRRRAQWSRLFPKFTLSVDQDSSSTIASSTSSGKTTFAIGPEDRDAGLSFGLTWDFADLFWNSDQTAIDVRSRLMVQLRHDLLEEVNRLYFERKRLLAEFAAHPSEDPLLNRERSLRIEELSARLDGLTGGGYSRAKFENN